MALLFGLLAVVVSVGMVWLLTTNARTRPPYRVDGQTITFRHSRILQAFSIFAFFGVGFLLSLWAILYPPQSQQSSISLIITALVLAFAGFLLCWESFRFQLTTTPTELLSDSPWSGRSTRSWSQVSSLRYSPANVWFILKFLDGSTFHISALVPGITRFLEQCEQHLKPEQLANAAGGYARVHRKLPFSNKPPKPSRRNWRRGILTGVLLAILIPAVLFVVNGTLLGTGETPIAGRYEDVLPSNIHSAGGEVRIVSYNIAKGFAHTGGVSFDSVENVRARLKLMAKAIREQQPDFVFLSEVIFECGPANVNQLEFLARECGLPYYALGENYNFGLPFYRIVGGNAILSRKPLTPVANISLSGRRPFYVTHNNRRALFASVEIGKQTILLGSLHNDSFNIRNNEAQVRQLLEFIGERRCVLAGDFNSRPDEPPIRLIQESGKFSGEFQGEASFPEKSERIDFIFGPKSWNHLKTKVIENDASDHRPVFSLFQMP